MRPDTAASRFRRHSAVGFTLVEVMLVITVIAILVGLAAPSYQRFMSRAHRTSAIAEMLQASACQERYRAIHGRYDTSRCLPAPNERYRFAYSDSDSLHYFRVEARPLGTQRRDACGKLMLDALGRRFAGQAAENLSSCWSGR